MRTAPVPDIPPIPGMNPGVVVAGGGGGGGGGSGDDGSGGNGNDGANGENGGDNAGGDGQGAGNCGQGGQGGCPQHANNPTHGDPVDVMRGHVFTVPHEDLFLPGPVDLVVTRSYNSQKRERDIGMGFGWGHTLAWDIRLEGRDYVVTSGGGTRIAFDQVETETGAFGPGGNILVRDSAGGLRLDTNNDFHHGFERVDADGTAYRLATIQHATRNRIALRYDERSLLSEIIDAAGRSVRVSRNPQGRVASLECTDPGTQKTIVFSQYAYDERGDLVRYTDADGHAMRFQYDHEHRMTSYSYANGLTFRFKYDGDGRCLETWGELPPDDPALDPAAPKYLKDGRTVARGIFHTKISFGPNGYSEVMDSERLLRYVKDPATGLCKQAIGADGGVFSRVYNVDGTLASMTDGEGGVTRYQWDVRGRLLSETDALGHTIYIERDSAGRAIRNIDAAGGVVECKRDRFGNPEMIVNQRGAVTQYTYDSRGLIASRVDPNGVATTFQTGWHGKMTQMRQPNGAVWQWEYDYFGRVIRRVDPLGGVEAYRHSDGGNMLARQVGDRRIEFQYDSLGNCVAEAYPEGVCHYYWGGLRWFCGGKLPDGSEVHYLWNREGWNTTIVNELKETLEYTYTPCGYISEVKGFDGSWIRVAYDKMGRHTKWQTPRGTIEFKRNLVGQTVEVSWPDETQEAFEYDARGEVVVARGPSAEIRFDHDAVGNVTRETQAVGGVEHWVDTEWDIADVAVRRSTSLGEELRIQRDACGRAVQVALDDSSSVNLLRDMMGIVTARALPGGASIASDFDGRFRLTRARVMTASLEAPMVGEREPEWVGPRPTPAVIDKAFRYSERDDLVAAWSNIDGATSYTYGPTGRLLSRTADHDRLEEAFWHDAAGNVYDAGPGAPPRAYGHGNRLQQRGPTRFLWDEAGFLLEKRAAREGKPTDDVSAFEWDAQGYLSAVTTSDGTRVEFLYDPYGRRVQKRVSRLDESGAFVVQKLTRFVWYGNWTVAEIEEPKGKDRRRERSYVYDDRTSHPWAHRDAIRTAAGVTRGQWVYYVGDILGTPEQLINGQGDVLGQLRHSAYGRVQASGSETTAMRFPGQYEDVETGLVYNHYRYYDPDTGRFISADPSGSDAGLNAFVYCTNPVGFVDAFGLDSHTATCSIDTTQGSNPGTYVPSGYSDNGRTNHSAGANAESGRGAGFTSSMWDRASDVPGRREVGAGDTGRPPRVRQGPPNSSGSQPAAHTEQNAIDWANRNFTNEQLQGSRMKLGGDYPPCPRCHKAMHNFASEKGAKVTYSWPVGNKAVYDGTVKGTPPASFTGHGKYGAKIEKAYTTNDKYREQREQYDKIWEQQRRAGQLGGGAGGKWVKAGGGVRTTDPGPRSGYVYQPPSPANPVP